MERGTEAALQQLTSDMSVSFWKQVPKAIKLLLTAALASIVRATSWKALNLISPAKLLTNSSST